MKKILGCLFGLVWLFLTPASQALDLPKNVQLGAEFVWGLAGGNTSNFNDFITHKNPNIGYEIRSSVEAIHPLRSSLRSNVDLVNQTVYGGGEQDLIFRVNSADMPAVYIRLHMLNTTDKPIIYSVVPMKADEIINLINAKKQLSIPMGR
ncbi:hypothetical protein [Pseudomonas sp. LB1P83]